MDLGRIKNKNEKVRMQEELMKILTKLYIVRSSKREVRRRTIFNNLVEI